MTIPAGTRLGPYEIVAPIGAGGMGEVFRANDTRLDRTVAIKILSGHLSSNPQLRERFDREARAISSLTHPHICTLHDIGHQDGIDYLVMEYLDGETLGDRIARGALAVSDLLRIGSQVAEALDRAHRAGIVHRDLKPGNVMLTKSGAAKLLDFGLAKTAAVLSPPSSPHSATVALGSRDQQATAYRPLTEEGTIIGTFQYMAPEQIEGREADARTDIFALGVLLYEMTTGKRAFEAKSRASLVASILDRDPPPVASLKSGVPAALERVIRLCIAKNPDERWQSAHDVAAELKWIGEGSGGDLPRPAQPAVRRRIGAASAVILALALTAVTWMYVQRLRESSPEIRFAVMPPAATTWTTFNSLSISPDGRHLVFFASGKDPRGQLYLRHLDNLETQPLAGTEDASFPFWSPDSKSIAFFVPSKLKKVAVNGGPPQTLCDAEDGRGGTWNRDGVILFSPASHSALQRVSASGGVPARVLGNEIKRDDSGQDWPHFFPDGDHFIYRARSGAGGTSMIYVASLAGKSPPRVLLQADAAQLARRHILFLREGTALAQELDPGTQTLQGEAHPVAENLGFNASTGYAAFAFSDNGTLVFRSGPGQGSRGEIVAVDRSGKDLAKIVPAGVYGFPRLSPDGRFLALGAAESVGRATDVWVADTIRGTHTRLTFEDTEEFAPVWSPDGTRIAYATGTRTQRDHKIAVKLASGTATATIIGGVGDRVPSSWSADGSTIIFDEADNIGAIDVTTGKVRPVIATPAIEFGGELSPDGKWLAYTSVESGRPQICVQPFPPSGGKWQISVMGGMQARWRGDSAELFYVSIDGQMMAVDVAASAGGLDPGIPHALFRRELGGALRDVDVYDVTRDGQKFIMYLATEQQTPDPMTVVLNWAGSPAK